MERYFFLINKYVIQVTTDKEHKTTRTQVEASESRDLFAIKVEKSDFNDAIFNSLSMVGSTQAPVENDFKGFILIFFLLFSYKISFCSSSSAQVKSMIIIFFSFLILRN